MRPKQKLVLAGIVVLVAVLAALPFRGKARQPTRDSSSQVSQRRWRETRAQSPVPLRMQAGESPAENLPAPVDHAAESNSSGLGQPVLSPPAPPRIPAAYRPLLEPKPSQSQDTRAVASHDSRTNVVAVAPRSSRRTVRHTIRDGDTLRRIADRYLGDGERYLEIYEANQGLLPSPETLPLGVEIEFQLDR